MDSLVLSAVCNKTEQDHCLVILWSRSFARLLRSKKPRSVLFIPTCTVVPQQIFPRYPRYRWGFPLKAPCLFDHGFQRFGRVGLQLALCALCCLLFRGYPPPLSWSIWKSLKQRWVNTKKYWEQCFFDSLVYIYICYITANRIFLALARDSQRNVESYLSNEFWNSCRWFDVCHQFLPETEFQSSPKCPERSQASSRKISQRSDGKMSDDFRWFGATW